MAEMSSSNQLAVQMPSTLESIKISMNTMVSSMAAAQTAINTGFNTTQAVAMRQAVSNVSVELTRYREGHNIYILCVIYLVVKSKILLF